MKVWQRMGPASRWALFVAGIALALAALNVWWFEIYRDGYPFDIDEASYTTFALVDHLGLKDGGLQGWWEAIQNQPTFAPLVPALTSLLVFVKPGILNGFLVLTAFSFVLAMAVYGIGARLAGPRLGALAALVTATMPGAFAFSREYVFAMPVAALLACAVYALLRSDGLQRRRWALACGAAIGLMLLSRTMAITYVPGVLIAAVVVAFSRSRADLTARVVNFVLVIVTALAVAATWYARNLQSVVDYLTNYGYGRQSQFYGHHHSLVSWGRLRSVAEHMTSEDLFLPLAVILVLGLVAVATVVAKRLRPPDNRRAELLRLAGTDAFTVAIVFVIGYGALLTSQNGGQGFTFPLAALLPPLAVLSLRHFPSAVQPAIACLGLVAAINLVSTSTIWATASQPRVVSVPGFAEALPVTDGAPKAVVTIREQIDGPETTFDDRDAGWLKADRAVVEVLDRLYGPNGEAPVVAFASRNRALNSSTVQLASLVKYHRALPIVQIEAEPADSVATYAEQLKAGPASVLISMSRNTDDSEPVVTQAYAETAARRLGFHRIRELELPDGRSLYIWQKGLPNQSSPRLAPSAPAPGNRRG